MGSSELLRLLYGHDASGCQWIRGQVGCAALSALARQVARTRTSQTPTLGGGNLAMLSALDEFPRLAEIPRQAPVLCQ